MPMPRSTETLRVCDRHLRPRALTGQVRYSLDIVAMSSATTDICIAISMQSQNFTTTTSSDATKAGPPPQPPLSEPETPGIIRDPDMLLSVLRRLNASNDGAICMFNTDRSFQIMLRCVDMGDDDEDTIAFEVALVKGEEMDDARWDEILQLEHDGYLDDDDMVFVMDEWTLSSRDPDRETLEEAVQRINSVQRMTVCPCNRYLIKDGGDMCPFCQLTCTPDDLVRAFCCVCLTETPQKHMPCQPCCSQRIHTRCLAQWYARSQTMQCPLCRRLSL